MTQQLDMGRGKAVPGGKVRSSQKSGVTAHPLNLTGSNMDLRSHSSKLRVCVGDSLTQGLGL